MKRIPDLAKRKHDIKLDSALQFIKDFRAKFPADNKEGLPHSEAFNKEAIMKLLNHPDCEGLRVLNGLKTDGNKQEIVFILMGIDKEGKNILTNHSSQGIGARAEGNEESPAQDNGVKGPPFEDGLN